MRLGIQLSLDIGRVAAPAVVISASTMPENGTQGVTILTFTRTNAVTPGAVTLSNIVPAGAVQMNADGVTLEHGATPVNLEAPTQNVTFTASFSDARGGPYATEVSLVVTNVNEVPVGPAINAINFAVAPGPAASTPSAFTVGLWSVADAATNNDATFTITTLPANNGSAITALQYKIDGGAWTAFSAATTGTYTVAGFTDTVSASVIVRAVNAVGNGADSDTKTVTTTGAPAAFTAGMWTITNDATAGDATFTLITLPSDNGSAITALEYKVAAGAWTAFSGTGTGARSIAGFTDGAPTNVLVRAVNALGNGPDSDTKSVTTSAAGTIYYVGEVHAQGTGATLTLNLTGFAGGIDTALAAGDFIVLYSGITGANIAAGISGSSGWTETSDLYANGSSRDSHARVATKLMGGTPDTSVVVIGGNNGAYQNLAQARAYRGVHQTTPLDVAIVQSAAGNSADMNPGSITPVTTNAMIVCGSITSSAKPATAVTAAPTGYGHLATDKRDGTGASGGNIAMADKVWTGGADDPSAFTGNTTSSVDGVCRFTAALRPA